MRSRLHNLGVFTSRRQVPASVAAVVALALGGAVAMAQTSPSTTPAASPNPNCAVSTARIGTLPVTQVFGVLGEAPQSACIQLEVANPSPGDMVPVGGYVIGGFAQDPLVGADQGTGITSVQVFMDDPNQGGAEIGSAAPSGRSFSLTVQIPSSSAGSPHAVFVQALSTTGRAGMVAIPVVVGNLTPAAPTRTP
jgi:hypothetical protein